MNERWVIVPNWDRYQHYKDRRPIWIKDYPEQVDRDEYRALSPTARALLQDVRRLYAIGDGIVSLIDAQSRLGSSMKRAVHRRHWKELTDAGLLAIVASKPLALSYQNATSETETEKERDRRAEEPKTTALFKTPAFLNDIAPDDVVTFASKLRDHDRGTEHVLRKLRREAPYAVFADAYGALEARRKATPPLASEVRYYVATVQKLTDEWKREAHL